MTDPPPPCIDRLVTWRRGWRGRQPSPIFNMPGKKTKSRRNQRQPSFTGPRHHQHPVLPHQLQTPDQQQQQQERRRRKRWWRTAHTAYRGQDRRSWSRQQITTATGVTLRTVHPRNWIPAWFSGSNPATAGRMSQGAAGGGGGLEEANARVARGLNPEEIAQWVRQQKVKVDPGWCEIMAQCRGNAGKTSSTLAQHFPGIEP